MLMILNLVNGLVGIAYLVGAIIILIQMFKAKGALHGILAFCCFIYLLVWAWQNADTLDANNPPVIMKYKQWTMLCTVAVVINIVIAVIMQIVVRM